VGVTLLDELDDVVSRSAKRDVFGRSLGRARMQDSDHLTFGVEDACARVTIGGEVAVLSVKVEDSDLPRTVVELVTRVSFQLGEATKGKISRLPILGHDEARVVLLVPEVGVHQVWGVNVTRNSEEMIPRVLEGWWVGGIGVEERDDLVAGELAG